MEIEGVEHAQEMPELGVRFTGFELVYPLPAYARSLCEPVLAESQLQPPTADLAAASPMDLTSTFLPSPMLPIGSIVPVTPFGVNRILQPIGGYLQMLPLGSSSRGSAPEFRGGIRPVWKSKVRPITLDVEARKPKF